MRYNYDANSRLTNRWSAEKAHTYYAYDPVGNLTNINYPVSHDVVFGYDQLNRVTNMVDAVGTTKYAYAAGGQLWTEDGPFSNDTVTNTYFNRLRVGLVLQQPTGVWTNGFWYDAAKRITNVASPAGTFSYTLGGTCAGSPLVKKLLLPNTSYITNSYDEVARLMGTYLKKSDHSTLNKHDYTYNVGNQRTLQTYADSSTVDYEYDPIGQLTNADSSVSAQDRKYKYDPAWNLTNRVVNTTPTTFGVDGLNQLTFAPGGSCGYDDNGNLIRSEGTTVTYSYDDENRLIQIVKLLPGPGFSGFSPDPAPGPAVRTDFTYDGLGRLRTRDEFFSVDEDGEWVWYYDTRTEYIYDGWRVIQERDTAHNPAVSYTRGTDLSGSLEGAGGIGGLLARTHGYSAGNWSTHNYYHADGNGNITYLVNSSQALAASYRYDAFGNALAASGSLWTANVYRFSSKEVHDHYALYYYGYRWYSPYFQRWLNRDPIGENAGINLYTFVHNEPVGFVDADGRVVPIVVGGIRACMMIPACRAAVVRAAAQAAAAIGALIAAKSCDVPKPPTRPAPQDCPYICPSGRIVWTKTAFPGAPCPREILSIDLDMKEETCVYAGNFDPPLLPPIRPGMPTGPFPRPPRRW